MRTIGVAASAAAALTGAGAAQAAWNVASSPHFVIYSQEQPESLHKYAERLERFDRLLRSLQAVEPKPTLPSDRLTIYSLPSAAAVQRVAGPGHGQVAGLYHGDVSGSTALTSRDGGTDATELNAQIILLHEYAHHFMLRNFPATYPSWFVEGYAEFVSTVRFEEDGSLGVGVPAMHRAYDLTDAGFLPLDKMMAGKIRIDSAFEGKAWLLTHYLTFEKTRDGQLRSFLDAVAKGALPLDAARKAFGDLAVLDNELSAYLRRRTMPYIKIKLAAAQPGEVTVKPVPAGEAAMLPVTMNSRIGVRQPEAQKLVVEARRLAAPYPGDAAAQCALAEAEDDIGNPDATEAAADRALKADPNAMCGFIFKGRAVLARAAAAKAGPDDTAWRDARSWFAKANRADLEHPWPMALYYISYRAQRVTPTENAVNGLLGAVQRAPQDNGLRLMATVQLLRDRQPRDARFVLGPMVGFQHGSSAFLADIYSRIGQDDPVALAEELERGPAPKGGTAKAL